MAENITDDNCLVSAYALPKTAIIGATGFVGRAFLRAHRRIYKDCVGTARNSGENNIFHFDLLSPNIAPLRLSETGHKEALIFAAISRLDTCENDKELTRKINVEGTLELISQLASEGIKPIFASSDNVFDGNVGGYTDDATRNPITEYGRQKAEVEERIVSITKGRYLVIRLGKVFSLNKGDGTLLDEMAGILFSGGIVRAAFDQMLNPILVDDLIEAVSSLQAKGATGIVNVCSPETWTRYDIAEAVAKAMGINTAHVRNISLDDLGLKFRRPKNTSMKPERLLQEANCSFAPLSDCIVRVAQNWNKVNER